MMRFNLLRELPELRPAGRLAYAVARIERELGPAMDAMPYARLDALVTKFWDYWIRGFSDWIDWIRGFSDWIDSDPGYLRPGLFSSRMISRWRARLQRRKARASGPVLPRLIVGRRRR